MKKLWLISNSNSGSYDADMCARIGETVVAHGGVFDRCITLPDDDLPTIAEVEAAGVEIVAIESEVPVEPTVAVTVPVFPAVGPVTVPTVVAAALLSVV